MNITNEQFLYAIFGSMYIYAHVTCFPDDPGNIPNDRRGLCWAGGYYKDYQLQPGANQFYTVSIFAADDNGKSKRRKANFSGCYVIGLDDVKEKLPLEQVNKLPPPSIILKSSNHSEQWLYILDEPETSQARLANLHDQLIANGLAPDGTDPGQKGVTRYLRLPEGFNTKAKRIEENGGTAPQCEITGWNPERKYTMEQLAEPFGVNLDAPRKESRVDGAADVPDHPILQHVTIKTTLSAGRYDVTCPWVDTHTGGEDNGSAVFTNSDGSIGFACHHGHCIDKNAGHVLDWIDKKQPGFKNQFNTWQRLNIFGDVVQTPDFMGSVITSSPAIKKLSFKKANFTRLLPIKWVLNGIIPEGFQCYAGLTGIGKSTAIASLSMVVAGFGDAIGSQVKADRDRVVIYVSEDTDQLERQFYGYCKKFSIDTGSLESRIRLVDARRCSLEELSPQLVSLVNEVKKDCTDAPLLILDTASSLFDLDNENDNSQVAKFIAEIKLHIYELLSCTVWLITHAAKTTSKDVADITPRGASAFMGDVTGTGSFCEQHGKKIFSLGKSRITPDFTEIMFESTLEHVCTVDDRNEMQTQTLWLATPNPSNSQVRSAISKQEKSEIAKSLIESQSQKVITYLKQQCEAYSVVTIKSGSGGSYHPPEGLDAHKLKWSDIFKTVLGKRPQTDDEKHIKEFVLKHFPFDLGSPDGWYVWTSTITKVTKDYPNILTIGNDLLMAEREEL